MPIPFELIMEQAPVSSQTRRRQRFHDLHKYRNAIAHGFSHDDLDIEMVLELIETARRLTNEQNTEEYAQT